MYLTENQTYDLLIVTLTLKCNLKVNVNVNANVKYQSKSCRCQSVVRRIEPRLTSSAKLHHERDEGEDEDDERQDEGREHGRDGDLVAAVLAAGLPVPDGAGPNAGAAVDRDVG